MPLQSNVCQEKEVIPSVHSLEDIYKANKLVA